MAILEVLATFLEEFSRLRGKESKEIYEKVKSGSKAEPAENLGHDCRKSKRVAELPFQKA